MKHIVLISGTTRLVDSETGEDIPSPYDLNTWRDVLEMDDGRKQLGEYRSELTSAAYTGPVTLEIR